MSNQQPAPIYLNLLRIRFPVGALTSIGHRLAGFLLFLAFPALVYLLELSLQDEAGYARAIGLVDATWLRLLSIVIAWSVFHHLLAGIRFLVIDTGSCVSLPCARKSALAVNILALLATFLYAWGLMA